MEGHLQFPHLILCHMLYWQSNCYHHGLSVNWSELICSNCRDIYSPIVLILSCHMLYWQSNCYHHGLSVNWSELICSNCRDIYSPIVLILSCHMLYWQSNCYHHGLSVNWSELICSNCRDIYSPKVLIPSCHMLYWQSITSWSSRLSNKGQLTDICQVVFFPRLWSSKRLWHWCNLLQKVRRPAVTACSVREDLGLAMM